MKRYGFTIVELMVIIAVLGILAGISIVSYTSWRSSAIKTALASDLSSAAGAMKQELNFKNAYPATIPASYKGETTITIKWTASSKFCLEAERDNIKMRWLSTESKAVLGACSPTP